jgi:hypothetical protein
MGPTEAAVVESADEPMALGLPASFPGFAAAMGVGVSTTGVTAFDDWAESRAAVERSRPTVRMTRTFIEAFSLAPEETQRAHGFCKNGTPTTESAC